MQLYLKTPLVDNSKYVPHLTEHCSWHAALEISDFFEFSYGLDGISTPEYTKFEYDQRIDYKQAIAKITTPIKKSDFIYETKILQKELADTSYDQRIYESVIKQFIESKISLNLTKNSTREEVEQYHKSRYTPNNIIAIDNNFNILYKGFSPNKKSDTQKIEKNISHFCFEDDEYQILLYKNYNTETYWELYFIFRICCFFCVYLMRWHKWEYFYLEPYFQRFWEYCWALIPNIDYKVMSSDFFENWKKYIITMFSQWYFKENFFLNEYFYWISMKRKDVISQYQKYNQNMFYSILDPL